MHFENRLKPDSAQMQGFLEEPGTGPIYMVNLLKFRDKAAYPDGRDPELTGREAYQRYSTGVMQLLAGFGGGVVFSAEVSRLMLGEVEELWDQVAIARYPNRQAMLDMMLSEEYQAIHVHRDAGLAGQLNLETLDAFLPGA
ncbi:DUF1330 domain-containing protein [Halieaceae bacterium]|nr:DUF1330 domain-containing protein [Halieaceae bacterium]